MAHESSGGRTVGHGRSDARMALRRATDEHPHERHGAKRKSLFTIAARFQQPSQHAWTSVACWSRHTDGRILVEIKRRRCTGAADLPRLRSARPRRPQRRWEAACGPSLAAHARRGGDPCAAARRRRSCAKDCAPARRRRGRRQHDRRRPSLSVRYFADVAVVDTAAADHKDGLPRCAGDLRRHRSTKCSFSPRYLERLRRRASADSAISIPAQRPGQRRQGTAAVRGVRRGVGVDPTIVSELLGRRRATIRLQNNSSSARCLLDGRGRRPGIVVAYTERRKKHDEYL